MIHSKFILPIIVISQFCCTSLWFAGNSVINDLIINFNLNESALGHLTAAVQFGFISGTLVFAVLTIADRFSPSKVFFISAVLGAVFNLSIIWQGNSFFSLLLLRFFTGFFLAGIYPVGMKIATDYYEKGLGKSLSLLVGALVLGTAFPHLLKEVGSAFPWELIIVSTSIIAVIGGGLMLKMVPDGPYRKQGQRMNIGVVFSVFKIPAFRSTAFGYFGHMWELYGFWTFVPIILKNYTLMHPGINLNIPLLSFSIIGIGGLACVLFGYLSQFASAKRLASLALLLSGLCCLISPLIFNSNYLLLNVAFLMFWGIVIVADSPLLSTLIAKNAPADIKGSALTIVNCIGFFISIVSIQLISMLLDYTNSNIIFIILAIGPLFGLLSLWKINQKIDFA